MAHCDAPTPTTTFRLPLKGLTAAGLLVALMLSALLLPARDIAPDMAWRGNSASLEMIR
ncbi:hypothetical protein [Oceanicola sp. S124]|uniref:hypothetical protein n=1 Tax=Oceanicola sp. S124 TaxID=1042378 RepID=UPI0002DF7CF4|nr:hypothetical protein [Oceanicola sp. S124]